MLKQYAKRLMMREAAGCFRKWREAAAMGKLAQSPQMRRVGLRLLSGKAWAQWADEAAVYKFAKRFVCGRAFRSRAPSDHIVARSRAQHRLELLTFKRY